MFRVVDKFDIDTVRTTPADLSKQSDVVKNEVLKRMCMISWLKMLMLFRLMIL